MLLILCVAFILGPSEFPLGFVKLCYLCWEWDYWFCFTDFLDSCRASTLLAELDDDEDLPEPDEEDDENEDDNQEDQEYEEVMVERHFLNKDRMLKIEMKRGRQSPG